MSGHGECFRQKLPRNGPKLSAESRMHRQAQPHILGQAAREAKQNTTPNGSNQSVLPIHVIRNAFNYTMRISRIHGNGYCYTDRQPENGFWLEMAGGGGNEDCKQNKTCEIVLLKQTNIFAHWPLKQVSLPFSTILQNPHHIIFSGKY